MASTSGTTTTNRMSASMAKAASRCQKPTYSCEPDKLLPEILSLEKGDQPFGRVFDALDHRLAVFQLALREIARKRLQGFAIAVLPVEHDHALQLDAVDEHCPQILVAVGLGGVVFGDQAANHDARIRVRQPQRGVENLAAYVLEVDVDAFRACLLEAPMEVARLVVDAGIEAQLAGDVVAFLLAARDADRAAAPDLRQLPHHAADRARGGRHHHRLARLRLSDVLQPEIRRDSRHADHAEIAGKRHAAAVDPGRFPGSSVELPAELRQDVIALFYFFILRFDHFTDGLPDHDLADVDALDVALGVAHAAAHVRIERQPQVFHQHLALARLRHGGLLDPEIVLAHPARRPAGEYYAPVFLH